MIVCKNCNNYVRGNFCSNCGHPAELERIDGRYIKQEIAQILQFEKGFFFTVKELILRPGRNIREFISENRHRLIKPIMFIFLTSIIYTLIIHLSPAKDVYIDHQGLEGKTGGLIFDWFQENYGYTNIILGFFIAFWTRLLFRKFNYNYFEILILLLFGMGIIMLIYSLFAVIEGLGNITIMQYAPIISIIYISWIIGQFFGKKKVTNYLKASVAYVTGSISFVLTAFFLGILLDVFFS